MVFFSLVKMTKIGIRNGSAPCCVLVGWPDKRHCGTQEGQLFLKFFLSFSPSDSEVPIPSIPEFVQAVFWGRNGASRNGVAVAQMRWVNSQILKNSKSRETSTNTSRGKVILCARHNLTKPLIHKRIFTGVAHHQRIQIRSKHANIFFFK